MQRTSFQDFLSTPQVYSDPNTALYLEATEAPVSLLWGLFKVSSGCTVCEHLYEYRRAILAVESYHIVE
jgi:hypothetical protein